MQYCRHHDCIRVCFLKTNAIILGKKARCVEAIHLYLSINVICHILLLFLPDFKLLRGQL